MLVRGMQFKTGFAFILIIPEQTMTVITLFLCERVNLTTYAADKKIMKLDGYIDKLKINAARRNRTFFFLGEKRRRSKPALLLSTKLLEQ